MKLLWCCLVALIAAASAGVDVEKTVKQVQTILQANSQLPRLSRDEIIQLLNDIRAEDAKSKSSSTEHSKESQEATTPYNVRENEINPNSEQDNIVADEKQYPVSVTAPPTEVTTAKSEPSVMVVLPYTPRDGTSLQELYTRPPRVEVVPVSKVTPKPYKTNKIQETLKNNAKLANQNKLDFPAELQAFLDSHGLKGKPGQDSFLLPLDGFKPLPPAKVVDGNVQLPENILLTYDLISPDAMKDGSDNEGAHSIAPTNYLYEPLRPEIPFELDTSSSEKHKLVLPLDMPKSRKTKSTPPPTFAPLDYDSVKVIPLNQGPSPVDDERAVLESEQNKRQAAAVATADASASIEIKDETTAAPNEAKEPITNAPPENDSAAAADSGPSISDLADSFGGAAPEKPGDSELPPPKKNGFYWMVDWNSFLEVGDGDTKVNIRFEPKLGDPQMFLPVSVP